MAKVQVGRAEILKQIAETLQASTNDPAEDLIHTGEVLIKIGEQLRGLSAPEARAVIRAVQEMI